MLHRERDRVFRVIELGKTMPQDDLERIGHWSRYACLACTGYIETAFRLVIQNHVSGKATPEVAAYVVRGLEGIQNPKAEKIVNVLRSFSDKWAVDMERFFSDNQEIKDAIDSLMANRHLIAHGRPCSISLARVSNYLDKADEAIEFINAILNPQARNSPA